MNERPMAEEHQFADGAGDSWLVSKTGILFRYSDREVWRPGNHEAAAGYLREELLRVVAERDAARAELASFRLDLEEREAACCPEDVGFEEYIVMLESEKGAAEARGAAAERERAIEAAADPFGMQTQTDSFGDGWNAALAMLKQRLEGA